MKLICFDLDNTLINSDRAHYRAYNRALKKLGFKKISFNKMAKHFGAPKIELAELLTSTHNNKIVLKITELHSKYLLKIKLKITKELQ